MDKLNVLDYPRLNVNLWGIWRNTRVWRFETFDFQPVTSVIIYLN